MRNMVDLPSGRPRPSVRIGGGLQPATPRSVRFARWVLWVQSTLAAALACWMPWVPSRSAVATAVVTAAAVAFAAANLLTAARLGRGRARAASGAVLLEIFWTLAGALSVVWPSGAQGYYEPLYLLLFLASLAALAGLLGRPAREFLVPAAEPDSSLSESPADRP